MYRKIWLLILSFVSLILSAQTIEITSFSKSDSELENTYRAKNGFDEQRDKNGSPCALIKITRADNMPTAILKELVAEGNGQVLHPNYIKSEGVVYFYVTYDMDQIKLFAKNNKTQQQSNFYNLKKYFEYNPKTNKKGLDPNAVYEMTLKYVSMYNRNEKKHRLIFNAFPSNANIHIDGINYHNSKIDIIAPSLISYKVEKDGYYTEEKTIDIINDTTITVHLKPIVGTLSVTSSPNNATIYLNGKQYGTTPMTIEHLPIGNYELRLEKENCIAERTHVSIQENKTISTTLNLRTSAMVRITSTPEQAKIYLDGQYLGHTPINYKMEFGRTYNLTAEKLGGKSSKQIHFTPSTNREITFNVKADLSVSPDSYKFSSDGNQNKVFQVSTPVDNWSVRNVTNWLDITRSDNSFIVKAKKNRSYNSRQGTISVTAANNKKNIEITQEGRFRKSTEDFSDFFWEYTVGYQTKAKMPTIGANFAYLPEGAGGHLGFYANMGYGFNNSIHSSLGLVTRWTHDYLNSFDFQFYGGVAYKNELGISNKLNESFGGDLGIRLTGTDPKGSRFGFYSATLGVKVFQNEIIPTIGISTGMLGSGLIFRDGRINDFVYNYQQWYLEFVAVVGAKIEFWGVGASLAYVPSSMGVYLTGMGGNLFSVSGGPVFRIIPEDVYSNFDLQVYTGLGYNSEMNTGFMFDVGVRLTGAYNNWGKFGELSATLGTQISPSGEVVPTFGISVGLTWDAIKYSYIYCFRYIFFGLYGWMFGYNPNFLIK